MKTDLFFYTGTGNSLWAARTAAQELGNAEIKPLLWITGNPVQIRNWSTQLKHLKFSAVNCGESSIHKE